MAEDENYGSSEHPETEDGRQYHIGLAPGEVAEHILLVGDPKRARKVASRFDEVEFERSSREYVSLTGWHEGLRVTVMGTGMSTANTEIAVIELCQCFEDDRVPELCMIRCGSTGGLQPHIELGDLIVSKGSYRMEKTSAFFVDDGYPSIAHPEVVMALVRAADEGGRRYHVGINATAAGFYGAQGRELPGFPPRFPDIVDQLARQGITNLEMEASALLTLASLRGFRAGAVCAVYATRRAGAFIDAEARNRAEADCIDTGLGALHHLALMAKARGDKAMWHPGLG